MVFSARATPDGATAFYTAGDNDKAWFGCSDGRVVSFEEIPGEFKFSPDGKNGAVMVEGKLTLAEMNNLTKLPPDKLAAAMNDQEKKFLHTIDGRSFGPFGSSFEASSFWYAKSSNDLFYRSEMMSSGMAPAGSRPGLSTGAVLPGPTQDICHVDLREYRLQRRQILSFAS